MNIFNITQDDTIEQIRLRLLYAVLFIFVALGLPTIIIAGIEAYFLQQYTTILIYLAFFFPIILVTIFRKRLSYKLIVIIVISAAFFLAISNMEIYGTGGAGIPIFFSLFVLTTIFFDLKSGLYMVLFSAFATSVIAYLYVTNRNVLDVSLDDISSEPISWITALAVLVFLGTLIVLSYGLIQSKMIQSIQLAKQKTDELVKTNSLLTQDVQKRKLTELELQKSKALLLEAHRIAKLGNWEFNFETGELKMAKICYSIMELNNDIPATQLMEYIVGRIHPEDQANYEKIVAAAVKKGIAYSYHHKAIFDNDRIKYIASSGEPIYDHSEKLIGYAGIIQDITELKQSEEKILLLNEELELKVKIRTKELELKYSELEQLNKVFIGRELRMVDLKEKLKAIEKRKK